MSVRIAFDLGDKVRISPPIWPDHKLNIQPGDLSQFTPCGNGVYGYQERFRENPIKSAPSQEPTGGIVYFGSHITKADFEALLRVMQVKSDSKDYAIFLAESKQPGKDGFVVQMRIVTKFGLRFMFGAINDNEYDKFHDQGLTIGEVLWGFIQQEIERWGTSWMDDKGLHGKFGGDGHFACEELAFGFMMENEYHGVYRIWSRAWLVTK